MTGNEKIEDKKDSEEKKELWWIEDKPRQHYDDQFFDTYRKKLEPVIPDDYSDPVLDEEVGLLHESTDNWKNAGPGNPNLNNLFKFYTEKIAPEMAEKKILVGILMPTANGMMVVNTAVAMATLYKPNHRFHTVQGHNIGILRNMLVNMALQNTDCTHLFFLDSDVIIPPYGLMRLLRRDLDIVTGIYTMKSPPYVPLAIMRPENITTGEKIYNYYFRLGENVLNKLIPCDATGAGCLLIKREVLLKMGPPWFQVTPMERGLSAIGEDLYFFDKAKEHGYQLYADLSIHCDHAIGGTSYPRLFIEGFAGSGPRSAEMVDAWNKNCILAAHDLPGYEPAKPVPPTPPAPVVQEEPR